MSLHFTGVETEGSVASSMLVHTPELGALASFVLWYVAIAFVSFWLCFVFLSEV